jgi:hypothetical protein
MSASSAAQILLILLITIRVMPLALVDKPFSIQL